MPRRLTIDVKIDMLADEPDHPDSCLSRLSHPAAADLTPGLVSSIWGSKSSERDMFQPFFSGKAMHFDGAENFRNVPHSIGLCCQRGQKPHSPNQDDFFVLNRKEWLFVGVMDGHGPLGHEVSHFAQEFLPKHILDRFIPTHDWTASVGQGFHDVIKQMRDQMFSKAHQSGTTASVALLSRNSSLEGAMQLRTAFVGDSSIVYASRKPGCSSWEVKQLGSDHRPDREDEYDRIVGCGGEVRPSSSPKSPPRLVSDIGNLAMSRSLGDFGAEPKGLCHEPETPPTVVLDEGLEHIILICSDGVWDVFEASSAIQLVAKFKPMETQKAAEKLVSKSQSRWKEMNEGGLVDDITAILVRPGFGEGFASSRIDM